VLFERRGEKVLCVTPSGVGEGEKKRNKHLRIAFLSNAIPPSSNTRTKIVRFTDRISGPVSEKNCGSKK
jgi:hypothetical protein